MKIFKPFLLIAAVVTVAALVASAADTKPKPVPYKLKTCIVSGDKLGGDMGDPYVYIYKGKDDVTHEIKFCCKSCLKDFNKDPEGYLKKISDEEAKVKKK